MSSLVRFLRVGAVVLAAATLLAGCGSGSQPAPGATTTSGVAPVTPGAALLAVKIDNVDAARPATGLDAAAMIYVEQVEGGLTRIVAVFGTRRPDVVGPVRSARQTDLDLLAQFGRPTFAYSGAAPQLLPLLGAAAVVNASPADVPRAYFRAAGHQAPHNLYVRPALLPVGSGHSGGTPRFGVPPAGGTPTTDLLITYPAASYEFRWSGPAGRWLVWMDGTPYQSVGAGQLGAATVVIQHVATVGGSVTGAASPVYRTIGSGPATVLRDGASYAAIWSRPTTAAPTGYTLAGSGQALPFAAGQVWVLLVGDGTT